VTLEIDSPVVSGDDSVGFDLKRHLGPRDPWRLRLIALWSLETQSFPLSDFWPTGFDPKRQTRRGCDDAWDWYYNPRGI